MPTHRELLQPIIKEMLDFDNDPERHVTNQDIADEALYRTCIRFTASSKPQKPRT